MKNKALVTRLPKGHRFVKQDGYSRGWNHNWAVFRKDGTLISVGGKNKKEARDQALKHLNFYS